MCSPIILVRNCHVRRMKEKTSISKLLSAGANAAVELINLFQDLSQTLGKIPQKGQNHSNLLFQIHCFTKKTAKKKKELTAVCRPDFSYWRGVGWDLEHPEKHQRDLGVLFVCFFFISDVFFQWLLRLFFSFVWIKSTQATSTFTVPGDTWRGSRGGAGEFDSLTMMFVVAALQVTRCLRGRPACSRTA